MHRWIIVDKHTLKIATSYDREASMEGNSKALGGPWSDASKFMHLQLPEKLHDEPISNLVVVYEQGVVAVEYVPCKCSKGLDVFKEVYDKRGNLMVDPKGAPLYAQLYEKQETLGMVYVIKKVS